MIWTPDTCGCQIERVYKNDSLVDAVGLRQCKAHAGLAGLALNDAVLLDNHKVMAGRLAVEKLNLGLTMFDVAGIVEDDRSLTFYRVAMDPDGKTPVTVLPPITGADGVTVVIPARQVIAVDASVDAAMQDAAAAYDPVKGF